MRQKLESPQTPEQPALDRRTDEELKISIRKKRKEGLPFDTRESELVARELREDREERNRLYRR